MYRRIVTTVITAMVFVAVGSLGMYLYIEVEEFLALVEESETEEVPVSPYGFGPYPEVPSDYPEEVGNEIYLKAWANSLSYSIES